MNISILTPKDIHSLSNKKRTIFKKLVPKDYWKCLRGEDPYDVSTGEIYAAVANDTHGTSVGIALTAYRPFMQCATLLSLPLNVSSHDQTLSLSLLTSLENDLRQKKCLIFSYTYSSNAPEAAQIESLFQHAGWPPPQPFLVRYHLESAHFSPAWFEHYRQTSLPEDFTLFHWEDLTPSQKEYLHQQEMQNSIPDGVSPFYYENTIEHLNSFGVGHQGKVIGWMITHRINPETLSYSSFYIHPDYRNSIIPLHLLATAIDKQIKSDIPKAFVEFNLSQVDHKWISFAKKRLAPYTTSVERLYEVTRTLRDDPEDIQGILEWLE